MSALDNETHNLIHDAVDAEMERDVLKEKLERAKDALSDLFQACSDLPLPEMDRMEKQINKAAAALKEKE